MTKLPIIGYKLEKNPNAPGLIYKNIVPWYPQYPDIGLDDIISKLWYDCEGIIKIEGYLDGQLVEITASCKDGKTVIGIVERGSG